MIAAASPVVAQRLTVAHLDTGRDWRGGQAQVLLLMKGLAERGVENLLLAPRGTLLDRARAEGLNAKQWRSMGEWDLGSALAAARTLAKARVQIAHCHTAHAHPVGVVAGLVARVRAVVVSRRVDFAIGTHLLSAVKYRMPVDRYLCISRGVRDVMRAGGVPDSRLAIVPDGIEFGDPGRGADLRALIGAPPDAQVVGTVAALAPHKNHRDLLRAAAKVIQSAPEVHFAWVGEGPCRRDLERGRAALGLESRVHLLGFREDARVLLRQFDLFVLSSYLEGLCTSLLDAQALGVPVIATQVGGIPEVVTHGVNGILVPPRNPAALAEAIVVLLHDPERRRLMAERARDTVRAFHIDRTVERTLEEYHRVLREKDEA